jgi:hypothetical protein
MAINMIQMGSGPAAACKSLRSGAGIPLGDAKAFVDLALPPDVQEANERLRDAAEASSALDDDA